MGNKPQSKANGEVTRIVVKCLVMQGWDILCSGSSRAEEHVGQVIERVRLNNDAMSLQAVIK